MPRLRSRTAGRSRTGANLGSRTLVSVVIPTRDRLAFVGDALESVLAQERIDVEVLVVDDASSDGTEAFLAARARGSIRTLRNPRPLGLAGARNVGARAATGEWLAFLDDDDLWAPDKLARQVETATRTDKVWGYSTAVVIDRDDRPLSLVSLPPAERVLEVLLVSNAIPAGASNVIVRRDQFVALEGFDERFSRLADWDLWLRLAAHASPATVDAALVGYRFHGANMSVTGADEAVAEFDALVTKHRALSTRYALEFDRQAFLSWLSKLEARAADDESFRRRVRRLAGRVRRRGIDAHAAAIDVPWLRERQRR